MDHYSYTKLHCLNNTPTRCGVRRRHPQGPCRRAPQRFGVLVKQRILLYEKWCITICFDEDR
jgi:hypothetical protein